MKKQIELLILFLCVTLGYNLVSSKVKIIAEEEAFQKSLIQAEAKSVEAYKAKLLASDKTEVVNHFLRVRSCGEIPSQRTSIDLALNEQTSFLNTILTSKEKIEVYEKLVQVTEKMKVQQEEEDKFLKAQKEAEIEYESQSSCYLGVTKEWSKNFRTRYEKEPIFKELDIKKEITIAVIDSGIDYKNTFLKDAIPSKYTPEMLNFNEGPNFDRLGHGTHVAGIILGVMPQAKILPLKSLTLKSNLAAIKFAIKEKVDIINISQEGDESDPAEKALLEEAARQGIVIVVAAGNSNFNLDKPEPYKHSYPAHYQTPNMIVVGNANADLTLNDSSNYGENSVDFHIRGSRVRSLDIGCKARNMTGTSMAAPVVAGIVAAYKAQNPKLSVREIKRILARSAHKPEFHATSKHGYLELSKALNQEVGGNTRELAGK